MTTKLLSARAGRPSWLAVLASLVVALAVFYYFSGADAALPVRLVPHLQEVPLTLEYVDAGAVRLPVEASGFVTTLTHDVAGPFTAPVAAVLLLGLLAGVLAGWTAVASTLTRTAFGVGMGPVIFFLLSLNTESLGIFGTSERYFLYLLLGAIGGTAFGLHAFAEGLSLAWRGLIMALVVAGLGGLLFAQSQLPALETALQLAAYATPGGAGLFALLVLWVGVENVRALLWFNAQAEPPGRRFGLGPFVAASLLYLGALFLYVWNGSALRLLPGLSLDPLVLLLPAVLAGGLGLRLRAPSYGGWLPQSGMAQLYPLVVAGAAGALAYAFATDNTPLLVAAREFTGLALLLVGGGFFIYVLVNFLPLIQRRLRVYRVVFEPRRLPFYTVYVLALGGMVLVQTRQNLPLPDQVRAGQYNHLGDLTRQQSEAQPDDLSLALLAERYYAESGDVLYRGNLHAQLGRAALYRFRQQRQNEINALNRALRRAPSAKVSLRLAALHRDPSDLFEGLDILRRGLRADPGSAALTGDLAQLFTQTALTDSVAFYLDKAEELAPGSYASQTNQLGFLLSQDLLSEARKLRADHTAKPEELALASNHTLLQLREAPSAKSQAAPPAPAEQVVALDDASFARLYHSVLYRVTRQQNQLTNSLLVRLSRLANEPANESYYEQLLFLQALARHARGEEQAARQLLLPLASGTTAGAAYYQNLVGMWQLQQGQYATAADQLAFAAEHGAPPARQARVYALALSGRADSARAAAGRLATSPDSVQRRWGQQALRHLASGLVVARGANERIGSGWLNQAREAEHRGNVAAATKSYRRIVREAPFNEAAVLAAGGFYARRRDFPAAYEALRVGLAENPASVGLLRAYALAAAAAGLTDYAADALAQLRRRLPAPAYATLAAEYAARQAARAAQADSFSAAPAASPLQ